MIAPRFVLVQRASALAVAALGFGALWIGGELDGGALVVATAALVAGAWEDRPRLSPRIWLGIQIGFLVWLGSGQFLGSRPLLTSFAALLIFVQVHRLLSRRTAKDDLYSYFIAFGQLLLASVLTVDAGFLVIFVLFLVALVWAMLMTRLALATERDHHRRHADRPPDRSAWEGLGGLVRWPMFVAVSSLVLLLLVGTMGLFFVLPRLEASFLSAGLLPPVHVSGFTESVGLGEIGVVQLSDDPVMRVSLFDRDERTVVQGNTTYWRGLALDRFDGRTWSLSDPAVTDLAWMGGGARDRGPPRKAPWTLRQEITLEPLDSRVLFHVADAAGIYGDFRALEAASTDGFFVPGLRRRRSYTVYSDPSAPGVERLRTLDPRASASPLVQTYTQLPDPLAPRIGAIAQEWTRGAATAVDAALLIQNRLRDDFVYSLAQPASAYPDPLLAFLDEVEEGHCEYFASSMVILLRTLGIPARIVNGFQGGEYNSVGGYWLVRQREAHSWVEVHFPSEGWVVFDPTPVAAGGVTGRARIKWLERARAWADYGRVRWADVMLDYGLDNQAEGVRAALRFLQGEGTSFDLAWIGPGEAAPGADRERRGVPWRGLLAVVALALGGAAFTAWRRTGADPGGPPELVQARRAMLKLRRRWGRAARKSTEAPDEGASLAAWADWAARAHRLEQAPAAVDRYYASRFGSAPVPDDLVPTLRALLKASPRTTRR